MVLFPFLYIICLGNNTATQQGLEAGILWWRKSEEVAMNLQSESHRKHRISLGTETRNPNRRFLLLITFPRELSQLFLKEG